jgi:hypothetical protein
VEDPVETHDACTNGVANPSQCEVIFSFLGGVTEPENSCAPLLRDICMGDRQTVGRILSCIPLPNNGTVKAEKVHFNANRENFTALCLKLDLAQKFQPPIALLQVFDALTDFFRELPIQFNKRLVTAC